MTKGANWAAIRDNLSTGTIQATHMLIGMPLASTMGLAGSPKKPMIIPWLMNRNGAATLSTTAQATATAVTITLQRRTVFRQRIAIPPSGFPASDAFGSPPRVALSNEQAKASTTNVPVSASSAPLTPNAAVSTPPAA